MLICGHSAGYNATKLSEGIAALGYGGFGVRG